MKLSKLGETRKAMEEITSIKNNMKETEAIFDSTLKFSDNDKDVAFKIMEGFSTDEIEAMDTLKVGELLSNAGLELDLGIKGVDPNSYFKDFIVFSRNSDKYNEEIIKVNAEISAALAESEEEMKAIEGSALLDSVKDGIMDTIATNPDNELAKASLISFNNGLSLDNIVEFIKTHNKRNILGDYKFRSLSIANNYNAIVHDMGITSEIRNLFGYEDVLFKDEEDKRFINYRSLLIFIIMKYVVYSKDRRTADMGMFILSTIMHLQTILAGKLSDEITNEYREKVKYIIDAVIENKTI